MLTLSRKKFLHLITIGRLQLAPTNELGSYSLDSEDEDDAGGEDFEKLI